MQIDTEIIYKNLDMQNDTEIIYKNLDMQIDTKKTTRFILANLNKHKIAISSFCM